jgi:putative transcriptional regulator
MLRVRLKADGRIVEILADGSEAPLPAASPSIIPAGQIARPDWRRRGDTIEPDAAYARSVRARTGLTQSAFAARIGVPIETVRNWEQGKRAPRGPARALLKVIEKAPDTAFTLLSGSATRA